MKKKEKTRIIKAALLAFAAGVVLSLWGAYEAESDSPPPPPPVFPEDKGKLTVNGLDNFAGKYV